MREQLKNKKITGILDIYKEMSGGSKTEEPVAKQDEAKEEKKEEKTEIKEAKKEGKKAEKKAGKKDEKKEEKEEGGKK